ncbi:MAG: cobalamin-dependent protein, partial [Nanoarchaeota archaeon]|nr:cobalamin-dependent protein [Nanoarchaeota archaeon]
MKKIILIFPKTGYDFATIQAPPHGLLTMAAHLLKAGFDVKILDQRVNKNFKKNLKKALNESLFVGISSMTGLQLKFAINISKYIKKSYPKTSIVWGGIHATILPDVTIKEKFVDFIIKGEGEETILELAKAINNKLGFKNIN